MLILFQAYYGLFVRGKIQPNESVFLNAGTNYTILAALNILQNSNVTVYVAVDNESQRQYLHKNYPKVCRPLYVLIVKSYFYIMFYLFRYPRRISSTVNLQNKRFSKRPTVKA